jgi:hypothetical protein
VAARAARLVAMANAVDQDEQTAAVSARVVAAMGVILLSIAIFAFSRSE